MKRLSAKQSLSILLIRLTLAFVIMLLIGLFFGASAVTFVHNNPVIQIINFLSIVITYLCLSFVNNNFKLLCYLEITSTAAVIILRFIDDLIDPNAIYNPIITVVKIIVQLLNLLCVYCFYKGMCDVTANLVKSSLHISIKRLFVINLAFSSIVFANYIASTFIYSIIGDVSFATTVYMYFTNGLSLTIYVLDIVEMIYIFRTIKALKSEEA